MELRRRHFQRLVASAIVLPVAANRAGAQAWPSRPVRWIVGYAPGGGNDIVARLIGQWFSDRLGQSFVIENKPGAATNIAAEFVVNAAPTVTPCCWSASPTRSMRRSTRRWPFNFIRDIAPVAGVMTVPNVMVVNPSFPAQTVVEFIAYAKANPDKINMASAGNGLPCRLRQADCRGNREMGKVIRAANIKL